MATKKTASPNDMESIVDSDQIEPVADEVPVDQKNLLSAGFIPTEAETPTETSTEEIDLSSFEDEPPPAAKNDNFADSEAAVPVEESEDDLKVEGATLEDIEANAQKVSATPTKKAKAKQQRHVERVIAQDKRASEDRATTAESDDAARWAQVKGAQTNQATIRTAQIVGAEELTTTLPDGSTRKVPVAVVKIYGFYGYIPLNELWIHMPHQLTLFEDTTQTEYVARAKAYINNMAGGIVPVVIMDARYNPDSARPFGIIASRRRALLTDVSAFYKAPDDHSRRTAKPVEIGDEVSATVVAASGTRVQLNVRGLDVIVDVSYLTSRYVENLNDVYHPGDQVLVRIEDLEWPEDDRHIVHYLVDHEEIEEELSRYKVGSRKYEAVSRTLKRDRIHRLPRIFVSGRDGETAALFAKNGKYVRKNGRYRARITNIYYDQKNNAPRVWLHLVDIDLIGQANRINYGGMMSAPKKGDYVEFNVTGATTKGVLYGGITRRL